MMTDPIADMLTRIRNALRNKSEDVNVPGSGVKVGICDVLKREGYIKGYEVQSEGVRAVLRIELKYGEEMEQVISEIQRFSKPGCRRYRSATELPRVRGGLGISVVSTNKGILSDRECRAQKVGGEVLCTVE